MLEQRDVLTLNELMTKLGLKVSRPLNINTPDDSLESLANSIEDRHHKSEDSVLNRILEDFSNPDKKNNVEIQILMDGSLRFYVNLLEKIKTNPALSEYLHRIHFRFVFKTADGGMMTVSTAGFGQTNDELVPVDDVWDTGRTAGLPLSMQLGYAEIGMNVYSRKLSSPIKVQDEESEYSAYLATPDSELIIFPDEWIYGCAGMNSNKFKGDWEINMYERLCSIPLTHIWDGSFNTANREEYLKLLKSLVTKRNASVLIDIFTRLGQTHDKVAEMLAIHNELTSGTNLPKFSTIEG